LTWNKPFIHKVLLPPTLKRFLIQLAGRDINVVFKNKTVALYDVDFVEVDNE
jgi:hypothetical protein